MAGLAPYGERTYVDLIYRELIDLKDDGSFTLNFEYFNYVSGLTMTNAAFDELFGGPPRAPESKITQREMDLACSIQEVCEEIMLRMARTAHASKGRPSETRWPRGSWNDNAHSRRHDDSSRSHSKMSGDILRASQWSRHWARCSAP